MQLYQYRARVTNIVDADTVDMDVDLGFGITFNQRFRINDYDAPETWRPRNEAEREHGKAATIRCRELLEGQELHIWSSKTPGIYGRFSATIWLPDGRNYAETMISEGFQKNETY